MGTRHTQSALSALAAIQLPSTHVPRLPGEPHDVAALLAVAERMLGAWEGVGDCLQREIGTLTQHRALLRLHSAERMRGIRYELPANARLYHVEFAGQFYGTLMVAPDRQNPTVPALPDPQAQLLARICGALMCLLEQAALLQIVSRHRGTPPLESLTRRQREVLTLMTHGLSDDEITDALHISSETLRRHRYDIYARLGVHSAHDLVLAAHQWGLVSYLTTDEQPPAAGRQSAR